ncbi:MAG: hypothetical protein ACRC1M_07420 [Methanobacteriaceae archaeon]
MAKRIAPTPILEGEDAKEFLKEMKRPNTPEEKMQEKLNFYKKGKNKSHL